MWARCALPAIVEAAMKAISVALPLVTAFLCGFCGAGGRSDVEQLREQMVKRQIEARGVRDARVLSAMRAVERHRFVPTASLHQAYGDHPLPIGGGQTISQPYIVALMSELCRLRGDERVLEIGTGSGYQAAVLSLLTKEVYSIELVESLGKAAIKRLGELGYANVRVRIGDGYKGWPEMAPFDVIIITAAPPEVPPMLFEQLKEGGIMVVPVGELWQELITVEKENGRMIRKTITGVRFVPMVRGSDGGR